MKYLLILILLFCVSCSIEERKEQKKIKQKIKAQFIIENYGESESIFLPIKNYNRRSIQIIKVYVKDKFGTISEEYTCMFSSSYPDGMNCFKIKQKK